MRLHLLARNVVRRGVSSSAATNPEAMTRLATTISSALHKSSLLFQPAMGIRCFSAHSELLEVLAREQQEEVESGNMELPSELADLKATLENDWRIVDDQASAMTNLFLKDSTHKVQVSFHCQDTIEDAENEAFVDTEEGDEPSPAVRFTVTVSNKGKTLVVNCISEFGEGKIEGVATTTTSPEIIHTNQGTESTKANYQGPDFLELDEGLQEAFGVYFEEECGITPDVAAFVAMYTDYKEQLQYAQFLRDAQSIIS